MEHLKHAFAVALEIGRNEEAATAISSLAQVHLRTGDSKRAEEQAIHALELIGDRDDMLDEVGNARLVLGRALLAAGTARRGRIGSRRRRRCILPAVVRVASCGRVDRPG